MNVVELERMKEKIDKELRKNGKVNLFYKEEYIEDNVFPTFRTKKTIWKETVIVERQDTMLLNKNGVSWSLVRDCDNSQIYIPNIFGTKS